jgi:antitoxin (DNA-binding transcriptional repressor) of toxin-antitoxin stability system
VAPEVPSERDIKSRNTIGSPVFSHALANVAICSYISNMASAGIRELKDNLSRYIRRIEAGERIAITAHGRVVAELVPPGTAGRGRGPSRFDELVAAGVIRPPLESGDPAEDWPDIRLPRGTATELIDADRGEA